MKTTPPTTRKLLCVPLLCAALAASCTGDGDPGPTATATTATPPSPTAVTEPSPTADTADIVGTWNGTWESMEPPGADGTFSVTFIRFDEEVAGTIEIDGTACVTHGTVSATLEGDRITFGAVLAERDVSFTGTLDGDSMSGTFSAPDCGSDTGEWEAAKST